MKDRKTGKGAAMYTGTTIEKLFESVMRAEQSSREKLNRQMQRLQKLQELKELERLESLDAFAHPQAADRQAAEQRIEVR
ncbi:MAG TPA: hypothetical protein VKZ53_31600 [Candidatus Angelobacter sp.]|nr:hypothetical protein [Candidatus Angelobacter sp.]